MSMRTKRRARWVLAPVLALGLLAGGSTIASAAMTFIGQNQPTVVQAVQGSTATLLWTYKNTGASAVTSGTNDSITFNAPTGTTFPAQSTVMVTSSTDGTTFDTGTPSFWSCTVGTGGTTLTCLTGGSFSWPSGTYLRFYPQVTVDPAATPGTFSAAATLNYTDTGALGATPGAYTITDGTLDVNIVPSASTPMVDPLVGLGAGALALGTGAAVVLNRRRRAGAGI